MADSVAIRAYPTPGSFRASLALASIMLAIPVVQAAAVVPCSSDGIQPELNHCAYLDYQTADRKLNSRYKHVMASLPATARIALRSEQRKWIKTRDPKCEEDVKEFAGGSIYPMEFYGCLAEATKARTVEIQHWVNKTRTPD